VEFFHIKTLDSGKKDTNVAPEVRQIYTEDIFRKSIDNYLNITEILKVFV
jgi:hypothetical protein